MNYDKLRARPKEFRLVCGLNIDEFDSLLITFDQEWDNYFQHYKLNGDPRINSPYIHKNNKVKGVNEKLFFILFYIRQNPTQSVMAAIFEMEKYQANQWIHLLLKILNGSLSQRKVLPEREPAKIKELLEFLKKEDVIIDGTERPVPRSTDYDTQKDYYSGKKKGTWSKTTS
ncbi:MAG: transposase family protein [Bacteroidetes bacterium]|jgi:hypothetical protein|nr:transposase family protein [Bacteroidota bacterium]